MRDLRPCLACARHVAIDESACPFCGAPLDVPLSGVSDLDRRGLQTVSRACIVSAGLVFVASLAACYGGPVPMVPMTPANVPEPSAVDAGK